MIILGVLWFYLNQGSCFLLFADVMSVDLRGSRYIVTYGSSVQYHAMSVNDTVVISRKDIPFDAMTPGTSFKKADEMVMIISLAGGNLTCSVNPTMQSDFSCIIHPEHYPMKVKTFFTVKRDEPVTITITGPRTRSANPREWKIKIEKRFDTISDVHEKFEEVRSTFRQLRLQAPDVSGTDNLAQIVKDMNSTMALMVSLNQKIDFFKNIKKDEAKHASETSENVSAHIAAENFNLKDVEAKLIEKELCDQAAKEAEERDMKRREEAKRKRDADKSSGARPLGRPRVSFNDVPEVVVLDDSPNDKFTPPKEDGYVFVDQATIKAKCATFDEAIEFAKEHMGKGYAAVLQAKSDEGYLTQKLVILGPEANLAMARNPAEEGAANMSVDGGPYVSSDPVVIKKMKTIKIGARVQCILAEDGKKEQTLVAHRRKVDVESELTPCTIYFPNAKTEDTKYFKVRIVLPDKDTGSAADATQVMDAFTQEMDGATQQIEADGGNADDYDGHAQQYEGM